MEKNYSYLDEDMAYFLIEDHDPAGENEHCLIAVALNTPGQPVYVAEGWECIEKGDCLDFTNYGTEWMRVSGDEFQVEAVGDYIRRDVPKVAATKKTDRKTNLPSMKNEIAYRIITDGEHLVAIMRNTRLLPILTAYGWKATISPKHIYISNENEERIVMGEDWMTTHGAFHIRTVYKKDI